MHKIENVPRLFRGAHYCYVAWFTQKHAYAGTYSGVLRDCQVERVGSRTIAHKPLQAKYGSNEERHIAPSLWGMAAL